MPYKGKYTKELLEPIVSSSRSISQVLKKLGLKRTGGNYRNINQHISRCNIDTSHFKGQGWAKGETKSTDRSLKKISRKTRTPNKEVFTEGSSFNPSRLKERLIDIGWEYKCAWCGISEWRGEYIRLHVDHINGEHYDHRLENLRFLCPNCHSQTGTYSGRNSSAKKDKNTNCVDCDKSVSRGAKRCRSCAQKERYRKK